MIVCYTDRVYGELSSHFYILRCIPHIVACSILHRVVIAYAQCYGQYCAVHSIVNVLPTQYGIL